MTSPAIAQLKPDSFSLFLRRLWALVLRHYYLHAGSWPRIVEMLYWPIVNMATWGFTSSYLLQQFSDVAILSSTLVASVIMVEIFVRVSTTMLMLFLEEIWSRNLGHMFASPLKFGEYAGGIVSVCFIRTTIAMIPATLLAKYLFGFSLASLGWPVFAYIGLLAFNGCWYGLLIISLLLRYGLAAEWLAWMGTWLLIPIVAPYYPVSVLPGWLQIISHSLPTTYVFECLKAQIHGQGFQSHHLLIALALNAIYFVVATTIFWRAYRGAQNRGGLLQVGE